MPQGNIRLSGPLWILMILGWGIHLNPASGQVVLNVPSASYPTIQSAIVAASPGNIVRVASGTYAESIDFLGKAITVESLSGPSSTSITGNGGPGPVVSAISAETSNTVFRGFNVINTAASSPPIAVRCQGSSPRFENCWLQSAPASVLGGIDALVASITGGSSSFSGCQFSANGNFSTAKCIDLVGGTATFTGCNFFGAITGVGDVSLIVASNSDLTVINGMFSDFPLAAHYVAISAQSSTLTCRGSTFSGGSIISAQAINTSGPQATISDCAFTNIFGDFYSVISVGGPALIERCSITHSSSNALGTCISGGPGVTVVETRILNNSYGLGVSGPVTLRSCLIARNERGGVQSTAGLATLVNCTIADNGIPFGSGIGGVTGSATLTNCIVWGNTPMQIGPSVVAFMSDIQGGAPGFGVINVDPLFVNAQAGDYHLTPGSPCIDRATSAAVLSAKDIDGQPRILYFAPDLGADEYRPPQGVALSTTQAGGIATIRNQGGPALARYFTALAFDPANAGSGFGSGFWGGLHASFQDLAIEFSTGVAPFVGTLDAAGGSVFSFTVPAGLGNLTAYGITHLFNPTTYAWTAVSPVVSHLLP